MKKTLAAVSIMGLAGAAGLVGWSVLSRPDEIYVTGDAAAGFNLQEGPAPAPAPAPLAAGETLRDAVASAPPAPTSLMAPIGFDGMAGRPESPAVSAAPAAAGPAPRPLRAAAISWVRKSRAFAALLTRPSAALTGRSPMASPRGLREFLADDKRVDRYMNSALVRVTLNSPGIAKMILGNPAVIRAFLASPAMRDPQAVRELLGSPMVRKMMDCPAIHEALSDPVVMQKMVMDPQTVAFIASNPDALTAIAQAVPALGDAFSSRTRTSASLRR